MRLKAFTVIEMLVVMLISTIAIGIAYASYRIVQGQFQTYKKSSSEISDYLVLDKLITKDFLESDKVFRTSSGFEMIFSDKKIAYEEYEGNLLRKSIVVDTFKIQLSELNASLKTKSENLPNALIDQVIITCAYKETPIQFLYSKEYGAAVWVNR